MLDGANNIWKAIDALSGEEFMSQDREQPPVPDDRPEFFEFDEGSSPISSAP